MAASLPAIARCQRAQSSLYTERFGVGAKMHALENRNHEKESECGAFSGSRDIAPTPGIILKFANSAALDGAQPPLNCEEMFISHY